MYDPRPVVSIIGRLTVALGLSMLLPALIDAADGAPNWRGMLLAAFLSVSGGMGLAVLGWRPGVRGLSRQQAFLLTVLIWWVLPLFGALPFMTGAPGVGFTDAFFEAMSALTTTGATVFTGLDDAPRGMLLWRALMQWYGGLGIVVVAMVFLPALKVGGMQFFRSEAFDLGTDVLPKAAEVAGSLTWIYLGLTVLCALAYSAAGMSSFDAIAHAMTTLSTGGMANYDGGFGVFSPSAQYLCSLFMILAASPFIRYMQLTRGDAAPLWRDPQLQGFLAILFVATGVVVAWLMLTQESAADFAVQHALFNVTSVMTGTGYASDDYGAWGGFAVAVIFIVGLIGGCTGSTSCSAKVFRYQILAAALVQQVKRIHNPSGVFPLRYHHRVVEAEIVSSVMAFFFVFVTLLSLWAMLLSMFGLDAVTSISGSVAALANIGPGLGPVIGPAGNYATLPVGAKWLLAVGMFLGRLEFLSVLVLLTPGFWRR